VRIQGRGAARPWIALCTCSGLEYYSEHQIWQVAHFLAPGEHFMQCVFSTVSNKFQELGPKHEFKSWEGLSGAAQRAEPSELSSNRYMTVKECPASENFSMSWNTIALSAQTISDQHDAEFFSVDAD